MLKSTLIALLAFAATVSAQAPAMPNHIAFTQPVGTTPINYEPGSSQIFSWTRDCVQGSLRSTTPTATKVELVDASDSNNAVFRSDVTTIDCTKSTGNIPWTVPKDLDASKVYSLRIVLGDSAAYSGSFTIKSSAPPPAGEDTKPKGAAAGLAPAAFTAATVAAGALILF